MKYTVKAGDSLTKIARDVLGDMTLWQQIANLNNIGEPHTIRVGQVLELPGIDGVLPGGALVTAAVQTAAGSSVNNPRVIEKGTTIIAPIPSDARAPMNKWLKVGLWAMLAATASYFLFPPSTSRPPSRRKRR
jgi:murein DD-endopeptidase MepM/ murein hydrolase activator NlpD